MGEIGLALALMLVLLALPLGLLLLAWGDCQHRATHSTPDPFRGGER